MTILKAKADRRVRQGKVELEKGGEKFTDWCNVLINGSGPINKWKCK